MSTREKNQKEWARNFENWRENCQKGGKKWARKPIFTREKSQNKPKMQLLGHFAVSRGKKTKVILAHYYIAILRKITRDTKTNPWV